MPKLPNQPNHLNRPKADFPAHLSSPAHPQPAVREHPTRRAHPSANVSGARQAAIPKPVAAAASGLAQRKADPSQRTPSSPANPPKARLLRLPPQFPNLEHGGAPSGSLTLDAVTNCAGWPKGGVSEIFGEPNSGKTTVALMAVREALQRGEVVVWMDTDRTLPAPLAAAMGVNLSQLTVLHPTTAEEAFAMLQQLLLARAVDLVVIDSLPALLPRRQLLEELKDLEPAQIDHLSKGLGLVALPLRRANATLLLVNHARASFQNLGDVDSYGGASVHLRSRLRVRLVELATGQEELWVQVVKDEGHGGSHWRIPFVPAQGVDRKRELQDWAQRTGLPVAQVTLESCRQWWQQNRERRNERRPVARASELSARRAAASATAAATAGSSD